MGNLMHMDILTHDTYNEDEDFREVLKKVKGKIHAEEGGDKDHFHTQNGLLYKIDKLYVPKGDSNVA
jgi:hypothetical protein